MQILSEPIRRLTIFASYAQEDGKLYEELKKHLKLSERLGRIHITEWSYQVIQGKQTRRSLGYNHLNTADIILFLISADFIASDYCYSNEMIQAMRRHKAGESCVIPILMRETDMKDAPFAKLQALPSNQRPVTLWGDRDAAFTDIAKGIAQLLPDLSRKLSKEHSMEGRDSSTRVLPLESAAAYYDRANAWMQHKQYELAAQDYDQAIELKPGLPPSDLAHAYIQKGSAHDKLEEHDLAAHAYNQALQLTLPDSDLIDVTIKNGWALYRLGEYQDALHILKAREQIINGSAEAHNLNACLLCRLKQYEEARSACEQAHEINSNFADAYDTKSWALYHLADDRENRDDKDTFYKDAVAASKQAIRLNPKLARAFNNKGRALYQLKHRERALDAYTEAIELYNRAIDKAKQENANVSYLYNKIAEVYDNQAVVYFNQGKTRKAIDAYGNAIKFYEQANKTNQRDLASLYKRRGLTFFDLPKIPNALVDFEKARTIYDAILKELRSEGQQTSHEYKQLCQELAWVWVHQGRVHNRYRERTHYQKAKEACDRAIKLELEHHTVYETLVEALKGLGDEKGANEAQVHATQLRSQERQSK